MKIDIEGLNKVKLVKALYDAAIPTEKTDMNKVITLDDIAYFVNKDRKINVINGKNIKCDIGRDKLSSGVYDKFNGEFAAIHAVEALNNAISADDSLGEGFCIGHSYFCNLTTESITDRTLSGIVEYELIPMLKEYWFDEPLKIKDWSEKLRSAIK